MEKYFIASVSFGKDSLAMLLLILEKNLPLNEVIFFDTGMEFDAIYNNCDKVALLLQEKGIKFTVGGLKMPFEDYMYNYPHQSRKGENKAGYGWCGGLCRWATTFKTMFIDNYVKKIVDYEVVQYVGIAIDEPERLQRLKESELTKVSPLATYNMTEADALEYCYKNGYNWIEEGVELYDILDRVSCWCCRNKNLKELRNYKRYLPNKYKALQELEEKIGEPMKKPLYLKDRFKYDQMSIFDYL